MKTENEKQAILIVDHERGTLQVINELLNDHYHIHYASDGHNAFQITTTEKLDLILFDINIPDMDGHSVCKRLKTDAATRHIPLIILAENISTEDEIAAFEVGAVDYITKPFSKPVVKARVKTHLELKKYRDILENLSKMDGLTGIANRRRFDERLEKEWRRSIRCHSPISLILMDIDHFKEYNDHYGHASGDECLKQIAKTLSSVIKRSTDLVARFGGEEFACILPATEAKGAFTIAKDLKNEIESLNIPHEYSPTASHVTLSIGIATQNPPDYSEASEFENPVHEKREQIESLRTLIETADKLLYEAKNSGRNQIMSIELRG